MIISKKDNRYSKYAYSLLKIRIVMATLVCFCFSLLLPLVSHAGIRDSSMDASDRLSWQQTNSYGSRWLIRSIINNSSYNMALDNIRMHSDFEKTLRNRLSQKDTNTIDLKGPKSGGEDLSALGTNGIIDMNDYNMILEILTGTAEYGQYTREELMFKIIGGLFESGVWTSENSRDKDHYEQYRVFDFNDDGELNSVDVQFLVDIYYFPVDQSPEIFDRFMQGVRELMSWYTGSIWKGRGGNIDNSFIIGIFDIADTPGTITMPARYVYDSSINTSLSGSLAGDNTASSRPNLFLSGPTASGLGDNSIGIHTAEILFSGHIQDPAYTQETGNEFERSMKNDKDIDPFESAVSEKKTLSETANSLRKKQDKTEIENIILTVVEAILQNEAYINEATRKEFETALYLLTLVESMRDMNLGIDFAFLNSALTDLQDKQETLYTQYLLETIRKYEQIAKSLNLDPDNLELPDRYLKMSTISEKGKKKILVDLAIKDIREKDISTLSENEKNALKIHNDVLLPLQEQYQKGLELVLRKFTMTVKKTILDETPVSVSRENEQFKALFILDKGTE